MEFYRISLWIEEIQGEAASLEGKEWMLEEEDLGSRNCGGKGCWLFRWIIFTLMRWLDWNIIITMKTTFVALALLLFTANSIINDGSFANCPAGGVPAVAGRLTISSSDQITLSNSSDVQCYNHTLAKAFDCPPSVAIGTILFIQASTILKVLPVTTYSFRSRLSNPTAME